MIRVLIAEDSLTAGTLLQEILSSDPDIQVVGQARNGLEAVAMTHSLQPDLVTMDIHMPEMDGLAATKEMMITAPTPIVVVTSSSRSMDREGSMHILRAGALEVLPKPPGPGSPTFDEAARKLITTVKAMAQVKVVRHWRSGVQAVPRVRPAGRGRRRVVAIATSTGGPVALHQLFHALPGDFAGSILVVQHISPGFASGLVAWLNSVCDLHVKLAEEGEPLQPHTVYLAPDGFHLGVQRLSPGTAKGPSSAPGVIALSSAPPIKGFRPSGTFLFESVANALGPAALAVILTGMGDDGVDGLRAVQQAGGRILAQDQQSCVIFGMPGAAIAAGLVHEVLPLDAIPARLVELL